MHNFTFMCLTIGLIISISFNLKATETEKATHAHLVSPEHYSVLLENDKVLVLKMTLKPGESDEWHKHNAETVYFESGGKATITTKEGSKTLEITNGFTMWHDTWSHQVSNVGETTIRAIIVEQK